MVLRHMLPQTPSNGLFEYQEPIHAKFDHPRLIKKGWSSGWVSIAKWTSPLYKKAAPNRHPSWRSTMHMIYTHIKKFECIHKYRHTQTNGHIPCGCLCIYTRCNLLDRCKLSHSGDRRSGSVRLQLSCLPGQCGSCSFRLQKPTAKTWVFEWKQMMKRHWSITLW